MRKNYTKTGGFIKIILIILILVAIISYFGFDLRSIVESEIFQNNLNAVFKVAQNIFNFLAPVFQFIWEDALKPYIFEPIKTYISGDGTATSTIKSSSIILYLS